ncbi:MAG: hypothetical protein ACKOJB_04695, partial [Chthoniobacterales bacterium]
MLQYEDGGRDALDVLQGQMLRREMHRRQVPVRQVSLRDKGQTGHRAPSDLSGQNLNGRLLAVCCAASFKLAYLDVHRS